MKIQHLKLIERDDWLVEACRGKRVLHVGCTDWPMTRRRINENRLLHKKICEVAKEAIGLDIDKEGIKQLSSLMPDKIFVLHNAEKIEECEALVGKRFDIILAADLLEHLSNIGLFLNGVRKMLRPQGRLLITTPHAFAIKRYLALIFLASEHVHHDHIAYFSISTLFSLLSRYGLEIEKAYGFQWRNPTLRNWFANTVILPTLWLSRGRLCDELALVVRRSTNQF